MRTIKILLQVLKFVLNHPLNRNNKIKSLGRLVGWQFFSRIINRPIILSYVDKTRIIAERGLTCGVGALYVGLLEFEEMSFLLHYLRKEDLFIDVGANTGSFTVLASGVVGANTISIEPIPGTFQRLIDNVNINNLNKLVIPLNFGLGDTEGMLRFSLKSDSINRVLLPGEETVLCVNVKVVTLDSIISGKNAEFLKIDVEGFETNVIKGGSGIFKNNNFPNVVLIELRGHGKKYGFNEQDIHEKFLTNGYSPCIYNVTKRDIFPWHPTSSTTLGDMIYIRDIDKAVQRVKNAPKFEVLKRLI